MNSVSKLRSILEVLDITTVCMGNPDQDLVHQWHRNALHSFSGKCQVGDSVLCLKLSSFSYLHETKLDVWMILSPLLLQLFGTSSAKYCYQQVINALDVQSVLLTAAHLWPKTVCKTVFITPSI